MPQKKKNNNNKYAYIKSHAENASDCQCVCIALKDQRRDMKLLTKGMVRDEEE